MPPSRNTWGSRASQEVGERSREGHELLTELQRSGVLARAVLYCAEQGFRARSLPQTRWQAGTEHS
jgi:F0F1-type ATP synthase beta subunit